MPIECGLHDDLWLGASLARRGIRRHGVNLGLIGKARGLEQDLKGGKTGTALYPHNRWNLLVCNHALVSRYPALWMPRPRLVVVGAKSEEDAVTRCIGHIDEWYEFQ